MAELRHVAGRQLDAELVESFIAMLEREGPVRSAGDDADFETELEFERRVREMAAPRSADPHRQPLQRLRPTPPSDTRRRPGVSSCDPTGALNTDEGATLTAGRPRSRHSD